MKCYNCEAQMYEIVDEGWYCDSCQTQHHVWTAEQVTIIDEIMPMTDEQKRKAFEAAKGKFVHLDMRYAFISPDDPLVIIPRLLNFSEEQ